jgi:DNA-binding CsgD family transcriptional regulator/tetratricopeptide (TPR) repeat protein
MDAVLHRVSSPTFVGRADELAALDGALGRAAAGVPAFSFVAGESGVGKSRLVTEFETRAREAGARTFVGHCLELGGTTIPYAPLVDALRPIARELAECGSDLTEQLSPSTRTALAELLPELGGGPSVAAADPTATQARVFEALLALIERLGERQPVAIVLEDLHWADPSTRDFLTFLVRSARAESLCLVVTYRSDELHRRHPLRPLLAELERTPGVERLGLERFSREESVAQVSAILDAPAPEELADRLYERSQGNALYTEELLAASSDGSLDLPDTLRDLLLNRVERLGSDAQEIVRVISIEHPMRHALVAELSELGAADLREGLREAVAHQVLVTAAGDSYAFRHALVGEAVYGDLLPGERSDLHSRLAEALERDPELLGDVPPAAVAAELACHWDAAHDVPRALGASVAAGLGAKRVYAFGEAKRHFERALELWDRVPDAEERAGCDRADVLRHAAAAAHHHGEISRSVAYTRKAIAELDAAAAPERVALLYERLGLYLGRGAGASEEGQAAYDQALALLPPGESVQRARVLERRARGLALRGRLSEAAEGAAAALEIAERLGDHATQGRALNTLGASRAKLGELDEGIAMLRRSRDLALESGPPAEHAQARTNLSDVLDLAGRPEEALEEVRAGMAAIRVHPERTHDDTFLELQGVNLLIRMGRLSELEPGLPAAPFGDDIGTTPMLLHQLRATVAVLTGELDRARSELAELRRLCAGSRDPQFLEPLHGLSAQLALLEDRIGDARTAVADGVAALAECEEAREHVRLLWVGLMVEATAAERGRALGEPFDAAAGDRLLGALAQAERKPGLWAEGEGYAMLSRAEATRMRGEPQPEAWEAAAERFDGLTQPWAAAYARFRAAEAHVQAGDRAAAGEPLRAACDAAREMDVAPLVGEIEALARRARVPLEVAADDGDAAADDDGDSPAARLGLTPREHEVLLLVAEGRTNREIGATLFMSEKTASVHVSRIIAKLGVGGRVEAAAVAHRLGLTAV